MRTLTIKRKKSFVANLMKVKFYITDETSSEVEINGLKCRFLGALKNGTEQSFTISEEEVTIFAMVDDNLVKKLQSMQAKKIDLGKAVMDTCTLPPCQGHITISGGNRLNPLRGNPFIFD